MGQLEYWLDFDPYLKGRDRNLYGDHGTGFTSAEHADGVLNAIRGLHGQGMPLAEAVSQYRKNADPRFQVLELAQRWLEEISEEEYDDAGEGLSPYTIRDYEGYVRNHWSWWKRRTIHDINYDCLSAWVRDMRAGKVSTVRRKIDGELVDVPVKLRGKTIQNILTAFRGFLGWYRRRNPAFVIPQFPRVKKGKPQKRIMPLIDQVAALAMIEDPDRGVFLTLAWLAKRQGEGRAILVSDVKWRNREVWIGRALKGDGRKMVMGDTKTGDEGWYPIPDEVWEWLQRNVRSEYRFQKDRPLFANPRTGGFYSRKTIQNIWRSACETAGVEYVPPNQALRHSTLSEIAPLIGLLATQSLSGHADLNVLFRHYIATNADTKRAAIEARARVIAQLANNLPTRSERNDPS